MRMICLTGPIYRAYSIDHDLLVYRHTDSKFRQERDSEKPKGCLMVPYSYDCNDFKFLNNGPGFRSASSFSEYLINAFDVLYEEGESGAPKMMTIGLHNRIIGRPGRFKALQDFVKYISQKEGVWVATRTEIAESFREQFPYKKGQLA
jgi:peptidoglycan/xylan/chitin deacetylase (PgdA/CDA1 family)